MTLYDGAGQADGSTTLTAASALLGVLGGAGTGTSSGSATGNGNFAGGGAAAGVAGGSASANVDGVLAGQADGQATVIAETHPFGGGTAVGTGALSPAQGAYLAGGAGQADGAASTTGSGGVLYLSTGIAHGQGTLEWDFILEADGTAHGVAYVSGSAIRIRNARGFIRGSTTMVWSYPLPMVGRTVMAGHAEVERVLTLRAITAPAKCFRYLQLLQRGDCSIFISDATGAVSPAQITYTIYQKRPDGSRRQVGPAGRTPGRGCVGEFYVTGRAGEGGQPGDWVVRWEYRRSFQGYPEVKEQEFRVLDAVLAADPRDTTVRVRKYGWN